ncbi:MAG: hypothetical protein ACJATI_000896 [Halioglobus sp.]|jgi:hypothetical protein
MKYRYLLALTTLLIAANCFSQEINIVKDLDPGFGTGFLNTSCNFSGDLYFAGVDDGPAYVEVFSLDEDLEITKKVGSPLVRGAEDVFCTDNFVYIYNREAPSVRDLYRSAGGNNDAELIVSLESSIVQSFGFNDGVVIVTEDNQENKTVYYISDDSDDVITVLEDVNLGQYDFDVTNHGEYVILSPLDDGDYEGGVTFFNTTTKQVQNDFLISQCEDIRYAYGFRDHIVYSCTGDYYVTNVLTGDVAILDIDGRDALRPGIKSEVIFESDTHVFIRPQEGDGDFIAIDKNDLSTNILSDKSSSVVNLIAENGQIYFTEKGSFTDTQLFQLDAALDQEKIEIKYTESAFSLLNGAVLNNDVHFIISHSGNFTEHLCSINTNDELINFTELKYSPYNSVLEVVGDNLIFIHNENNLGIELYSLSYLGSSVEDNHVQDLSVYPNPSSGVLNLGVDKSEVVNIEVINITGQRAEFTLDGNILSISRPGFYTVQLITKSTRYAASVLIAD